MKKKSIILGFAMLSVVATVIGMRVFNQNKNESDLLLRNIEALADSGEGEDEIKYHCIDEGSTICPIDNKTKVLYINSYSLDFGF